MGIAPDRFAANNSFASAAQLGYITQTTVVGNLTIPQASNVHVFAFETPYPGIVYLASANTVMLVGDAVARPVVSGTGLIAFAAPVAGARYFLVILSPNGQPVPSFGFAIQTSRSRARRSGPLRCRRPRSRPRYRRS